MFILQFIKKFLSKLGINLENNKYYQILRSIKRDLALSSEYNTLIEINSLSVKKYLKRNSYDSLISIVVFSFDRAFQLDSLLGSFYEKVKDSEKYNVQILYRTSNEEHSKAYNELKDIHRHPNLIFVEQTSKDSFSSQLYEIMDSVNAEKIMFLVDDIVFIEDLDIDDFAKYDSNYFITSPKLGKNAIYSYMNRCDQKIPDYLDNELFKDQVNYENKLFWIWGDADNDWNYMFSVDGNIFSRLEMRFLMNKVKFRSPNTFEGEIMNTFNKYYKAKIGVCYQKSALVNLPINHVMNDSNPDIKNNKFGDIHQDELLKLWKEGKRMDYKGLYGYKNKGVHEEIPFNVITR
jgi:hypothetical protein